MADRHFAPDTNDLRLQWGKFAWNAANAKAAAEIVSRYPAGRQASASIPFLDGGREQDIHWLHRLTVLLGLAFVGWLRFEVDRLEEPSEGVRFGVKMLLMLFVAQITIGWLNIFTRFSAVALVSHLAVAAGISTLSTPMPARPMTFSRVAFSRIFAVALVAERMARPS